MTRNERWMIRAALARVEGVRTPEQERERARELRLSIAEGEYERSQVAKAMRYADRVLLSKQKEQ